MSATEKSSRELVLGSLAAGMQSLSDAYSVATSANAMAADLPVFQKLLQLQKEITAAMQEVGKVRGLD